MSALAQDQKISCSAVPAAVRLAFEKAFPKATMKACAKKVEGGKTAYEIESTEGEIRRDVLFHADGILIVVEEVTAVGNMPEPVQRAVRKKYPGGVITLSKKVMRGATVLYEFRVKYRGKVEEVFFDASGNEVEE